MQVIFEQLDLKKTRATWPAGVSFQPAMVKSRRKFGNQNWTVLSEKHINGHPPSWAYAHHDDYVRIPLFQYELPVQLDRALAFFLQVGIEAAADLMKPIRSLYVITGVPVDILFDPEKNEDVGLRYWIGFAVVTEEV
jgi:hypothetical protein